MSRSAAARAGSAMIVAASDGSGGVAMPGRHCERSRAYLRWPASRSAAASCTLIRIVSITCPLTGGEDGWYEAVTRDLPVVWLAVGFLAAATRASWPNEAA